MARFSQVSVAIALTLGCNSARFHRKANISEHSAYGDAKNIPCPALAAVFNAGSLPVDSFGRISQVDLVSGIMSSTAASQAVGIILGTAAGYDQEDIHQRKKLPSNQKKATYLNLMALREIDQCSPSSPYGYAPSGFPCSQTAFLGQHGFSTYLRHGQSDMGFSEFVLKADALKKLPGNAGRGLTHVGLANLLKNIRYKNGDYSGYLALTPAGKFEGSNMEKFQGATDLSSPQKYLPMSEWQELLAWCMLLSAFGQDYDGTWAIHEDDLRSLIIQGQLPANYKPRTWTLRDVQTNAAALAGMGAVDAYASIAKAMVAKLGNAPDMHYLGAFVQWQAGMMASDS